MYAVELEEKEGRSISHLFRSILDSNPAGMFHIDRSGRLVELNSRASDIFGFSGRQDGQGKHLSQLEMFFSQSITDRILNLFDNNMPLVIDCFPGSNLAGHFAYYSLTCNSFNNGDDMAAGIFGVIEEVTDRVKSQQELKNRVDELSILSQISQVVSSALDTEEILKVILTGVTARQGLGFNRAFLFLYDRKSNRLVGRFAIGPVDAADAGNKWGALENDERPLLEILSIYQEKSEGNDRNLTDLIRNITIELANDSIVARVFRNKMPQIIDNETPLDEMTEYLLDRLGEKRVAMTPLVSRDRSIGLLIVDNAITGEEITDSDKQFLKLIADQTAAAVERSYLHCDIKERALELENANKMLAETQNQIIEAEKMSVIGEITSAVAHELRNPLTIIGGFANLIYKNNDSSASNQEYLNIIISETQRAESVLTDVLDFSRASKTRDRRLNLNDLVKNALDMSGLRLKCGKNRIKVVLSDSDMPIWGNPDLLLHSLYQIFYSLISDLSAEVPRVTTYTLPDSNRVEISFLNSKKHNEKIKKTLVQYFGGGNSTKRLSLIVAEETLKHHGGSLGVESNQQGGAMLCIQLPKYKEMSDAHDSGG